MAYQYLFLDYETFSLLNLKEVGLDNYAKDPSTGVSMLGWSCDHEDVEIWLPHEGPPPQKLLDAWRDPTVIKVAWSAQFEFNITNHVAGPRYIPGGLNLPMSQYRDPIVLAHNLSLPGKLEMVGAILKMANQKDKRGDELKKMFCMPVSKGGNMTLFGIAPPLFRDHNSHPREFAEYIEYCKQDVRTERDLWYRLLTVPFPDIEWQGWLLDQKINAYGMPGNRDLAQKGQRLALRFMEEQRTLLKSVTGLENPMSDKQMLVWATARGYPWNSLRAPTVKAELKSPDSKITRSVAGRSRFAALQENHPTQKLCGFWACSLRMIGYGISFGSWVHPALGVGPVAEKPKASRLCRCKICRVGKRQSKRI